MLGFVGDLVPLFWSFEQIHLQWEISREVEGLNSQICLYAIFSFHRVWVLALYGFSLLVCPQPLIHNSPHRKVIQNELIRQSSMKKILLLC